MAKVSGDIARIEAKLGNADFLKRAPEEVVDGEREKREEAETRRAKILEVPALKLGTVGGTELVVRTPTGEWKWNTADLHDQWWNSIARAMQ